MSGGPSAGSSLFRGRHSHAPVIILCMRRYITYKLSYLDLPVTSVPLVSMRQKQIKQDVFRAVADPTRRAILDQLRESERSVNELIKLFNISQSALSQHLRVLLLTNLVNVRRVGRQRIYRVNAVILKEVYDWAEHYERLWNKNLDALDRYLEGENK
jgi:DNA-binding transcriptional ArsR family regulator